MSLFVMASLSRHDHRIILHLDYDCFYASVFEVEQPALKSLPLAVQQKHIVVTCNYEARRRGLRKLQLIRDAKRICPDVVIVLGEDLTRFRDASKDLYRFIRAFVWSGKVERLGFDELFLDVTDMIDYNAALLNPNDLPHSFFHLDQQDPTAGFMYDATTTAGSTYPATPTLTPNSSRLHTRLLLASHLAHHLRTQLEHETGFTATGGISTSKLLAKLAGELHKPNGQTTLLPPYDAAGPDSQGNVLDFMDRLEIRKIPGIGSKMARKLRAHVAKGGQSGAGTVPDDDDKVTVQEVRSFPGMGPVILDRILGGPGAPKDIGVRVWRLIHGVDGTDVLDARDLPTQISIEDTYGRLDTLEQVKKELTLLTVKLIRRMRTDLTEPPDRESDRTLWAARPRTFRLSTRLRAPSHADETTIRRNYNRVSRSAPLPQHALNLDESVESLGERLVQELALPMFRRLHPERSWNLQLLNVAVTNMVEGAGMRKQSSGRDIGRMFFQQQGTGRREDRLVEENQAIEEEGREGSSSPREYDEEEWDDGAEESTSMPSVPCTACGALIPHFALTAHQVFHAAPD